MLASDRHHGGTGQRIQSVGNNLLLWAGHREYSGLRGSRVAILRRRGTILSSSTSRQSPGSATDDTLPLLSDSRHCRIASINLVMRWMIEIIQFYEEPGLAHNFEVEIPVVRSFCLPRSSFGQSLIEQEQDRTVYSCQAASMCESLAATDHREM